MDCPNCEPGRFCTKKSCTDTDPQMTTTPQAASVPELPRLPEPELESSQFDAIARHYKLRSFSARQMEAHYLKGYNDARAALDAQRAGREAIGWLPKWALGRLTGEIGSVADPVTWGIDTHIYKSNKPVPDCVPIYAEAAAPALVGLPIKIKRELFSFSSEQQWVNKAQSWYANCGVQKGFYITVDAAGHIMHRGLCFKNAVYPVTCYELQTNWDAANNIPAPGATHEA